MKPMELKRIGNQEVMTFQCGKMLALDPKNHFVNHLVVEYEDNEFVRLKNVEENIFIALPLEIYEDTEFSDSNIFGVIDYNTSHFSWKSENRLIIDEERFSYGQIPSKYIFDDDTVLGEAIMTDILHTTRSPSPLNFPNLVRLLLKQRSERLKAPMGDDPADLPYL